MTAGTLVAHLGVDHDDGAREDAPFRSLATAAPTHNSGEETKFVFGSFLLRTRSRLLLRDGRSVCLGSRAFDLLHVLLRSAGTLVSKEALVSEIWPDTFVDESNLRFQMTCLRKALGNESHFIKTIPGRGYVFTGDCRRLVPLPERPAELFAALTQDGREIRNSTQVPSFSIGPAGSLVHADAQSAPYGVWHLASLSIVRAARPTPAGPTVEKLVSAVRDDNETVLPEVQLLMPMLILRDSSKVLSGEQRQLSAASAVDLISLLELLQPVLQCVRDD